MWESSGASIMPVMVDLFSLYTRSILTIIVGLFDLGCVNDASDGRSLLPVY